MDIIADVVDAEPALASAVASASSSRSDSVEASSVFDSTPTSRYAVAVVCVGSKGAAPELAPLGYGSDSAADHLSTSSSIVIAVSYASSTATTHLRVLLDDRRLARRYVLVRAAHLERCPTAHAASRSGRIKTPVPAKTVISPSAATHTPTAAAPGPRSLVVLLRAQSLILKLN